MSEGEDVYDVVRHPIAVMECQRCGAVMSEYESYATDEGVFIEYEDREECPSCGGPLKKGGKHEET